MQDLRILMIEDNPGDARLIQELLREVGDFNFHLEWVEQLAIGLARLRGNRYDAVLLDLSLPDSKGLETFLKVQSQASKIPIVVLTGNSDEKLAQQILQASGQDYLIKGHVDSHGLTRAIRYAIERYRMQMSLQDGEARFRRMIESNPDGLLIVGQDGVVQYANPTAQKMFDRQSRELSGQSFGFPIVIGEMTELEIPRQSQCPLIVEMRVEEIVWEGVNAYLATMRDITARKRAEDKISQLNAELEQRVIERTAELSDLYNNAPCGYHSLDGDGLFVRINDTELNLLGYMREELIGKVMFDDLLTPARAQTFLKDFPVFKERGWMRDLELDMVRKDGSILPVLLSASVLKDQDGCYLMSRCTIIDHTERKRADTKIHQAQVELEVTNKELESFAYSVSHDLRAPLRGIDGWSLALLEDYYDQLDEQGRQYLDRVRSEAQRMGRLIDDLLQLSHVTHTEMQTKAVDLSALAQTVVARLQAAQPERQVEVIIQPGLTAQGDGALLAIVLTNLLDNAWKFTGTRRQARIEFGCLPHPSLPSPIGKGEEGEGPVYFVKDNGVGFDMAFAQKLFGVFQRMHNTSEFPGTGIGLATVQRIVHRHGGRVWAEAQVDQGATFYFSIEEAV